MRVAVTGCSGEFGNNVVDHLLRYGHEVVGLSRRPYTVPSPAFTHVATDVRDVEAVTKAIDGTDAVVHLAWTTHPIHDLDVTRAIDVGGTRSVVTAMQKVGCPRLVFSSSVMAYGANADNPARLRETDSLRPSKLHVYSQHKVKAEQVVRESGVNALMVRATNIMGRSSIGVTQQGFAAPATIGMLGNESPMQFIHPEDLGRFFAMAVDRPEWTGPVNLAAEDVVPMREIAEILHKRYVRLPPRLMMVAARLAWATRLASLGPGDIEALTHFPLVDTTKLTDELGFRCAWSSRECVEDFSRTNRQHVFLGARRVDVPWRWPFATVPEPDTAERERRPAAPEGVAGEFDTLVDPRYSVFTCANTSEAFPGPMTPLSLETSVQAMKAAGRQCADVLKLDGELRRILTHEQIGAFGHGVYANLTVVAAMANAIPGNDPSAWDDMIFGGGTDLVEVEKVSALGMLRRLPWIAAKGASFNAETKLRDAEARAAERSAEYFRGLDDDQLLAKLQRAKAELTHCWATAAQGAIFITAVLGIIEKQAGKDFATTIRGGTQKLASAGAALGVHQLAERARSDERIAAILRSCDAETALAQLKDADPGFVERFDSIIAEYGHRGPRETELANTVFADNPSRLLDAVVKLLDAPERQAAELPAMNRKLTMLANIAAYFQQARERIRDAAIRYTHQYRLAVRERGRRLAEAGVLDDASDVFYLVEDEVLVPPADARERVSRRRAERERLAGIRVPRLITESWVPVAEEIAPLQAGEKLNGIGVSAGQASGPVRILTVDSMDDLEPGEVLVTEFTDTGWTPFFSYAAAVVVDTGGEMSHAAVVAREFGIPCVVNTENGSRRLRNGQRVEVDGAAGTVSAVD